MGPFQFQMHKLMMKEGKNLEGTNRKDSEGPNYLPEDDDDGHPFLVVYSMTKKNLVHQILKQLTRSSNLPLQLRMLF